MKKLDERMNKLYLIVYNLFYDHRTEVLFEDWINMMSMMIYCMKLEAKPQMLLSYEAVLISYLAQPLRNETYCRSFLQSILYLIIVLMIMMLPANMLQLL